MRRNPHLYELNSIIFLRRMSRKYGRTLTLATIPDEEWQLLNQQGFDLVWLMGVWQRSAASRKEALSIPYLRQEYDKALPDWNDEDVSGSPFAVHSYEIDTSLGKPGDLAQLRSKLTRIGLRLILDFVPNHFALDHPWTRSHPQRFIQGNKRDTQAHPEWFFSPDKGFYLAHGRDPHFPPWSDTVQVNFYSNEMRQALINELTQIADVADGVRCDMAMLALNDVFEQVWGEFIGNHQRPETEFWIEAIKRVKQDHPDFLFLAEVYWGFEDKLRKMGFDFTYDKLFYDKLRYSTPNDIREYLILSERYHQHLIRFIENHDEERAITTFGQERSLAVAVILATVPGLRLFHDGQMQGRSVRLPIQLVREREETQDPEIIRFYERLLAVCHSPAFHEGEWRMVEVNQNGEGNKTYQNLLAWQWQYRGQLKVVVVNYSAEPADGVLKLTSGGSGRITLHDELTGLSTEQNAQQIANQGLYIRLNAWQAQILDLTFGSCE